MKIPVLEGQQMIGGVSIREEGLYRVISARVGLRPGVQRLWLCSGTQGACLGVLAPEAGFLRLEKRLSRAAWAALPAPLTHAALSRNAVYGEKLVLAVDYEEADLVFDCENDLCVGL